MNAFSNELLIDKENVKESFGDRLSFQIKEKGLSKLWLANKLGISKQALNYLINHSIKPKFVDQLAEILNIEPSWLEYGTTSPLYQDLKEFIEQKIPIYDSNSLLNYFDKKTIEDNLNVTYFKHTNIENIIAFKLSSECLFPPIIENSILFFDTKKNPSNGDFVLLITNGTILVRQFILEGNNICYYAPNNKYQSLANIKAEIKGTLIEARYSPQR